MLGQRHTLVLAVVATGLLVAGACGPSEEDKAFQGNRVQLVSPEDGQVFDNYPRYVYLQWQPVEGVARYMVEVEMGNKLDGTWMPAPPELNKVFAYDTHLQILFVGANPGRWRVWAVNQNNTRSQPSDWWHFEFTR